LGLSRKHMHPPRPPAHRVANMALSLCLLLWAFGSSFGAAALQQELLLNDQASYPASSVDGISDEDDKSSALLAAPTLSFSTAITRYLAQAPRFDLHRWAYGLQPARAPPHSP
jgi:hypothetical protein